MGRTQRNRRRGSMYITVVSCTLSVSIIGLASLALLKAQRRWATETADFAQSRLHARSAIEMAFYHMQADPNWRDEFTSGTWESDRAIGNGLYTLMGVDPDDDDLADSFMDSLVLTGIGEQGSTIFKLQVGLSAKAVPFTCLEASLHAGSSLMLGDATTAKGAQMISTNGSIQVGAGCTVYPSCESVGSISGTVTPGSTTTGITPRSMPNPSSVFDYYLANGTNISPPSNTIEQVVISPNNNPYGASKNALGIYVVDCQGQNLTVRNARIVGTLVVLNPGGSSEIRDSVSMEPAVGNYPILMVNGSFTFRMSSAALSEATFVNFNPPGTPSEGTEDTDRLDTYPSRLKGLVYVSGSAGTSDYLTIDGAMTIGGTFSSTGTVDLTYRDTYYNEPPPGFEAASVMKIVPGSWKQTTD